MQELLDGGHLTEEQARAHPQRSLVLKALDRRAREPAPVTTFAGREGDRLLLCSDGLTDVVSDDEIAATLAHGPADGCAERLVELALAAGARDNVTVVVADVAPRDEPSPAWTWR